MRPTEPGWYWYWDDSGVPQVFDLHWGRELRGDPEADLYDDCRQPLSIYRGQFAGPLVPPERPKEWRDV